jgi:hypothetical protein
MAYTMRSAVVSLRCFNRLAGYRQSPCHWTSNNYINTGFDSKNNDHFLFLEEHFFSAVALYKKNFEVKFENLTHEFFYFFVHVILMAIFLS